MSLAHVCPLSELVRQVRDCTLALLNMAVPSAGGNLPQGILYLLFKLRSVMK